MKNQPEALWGTPSWDQPDPGNMCNAASRHNSAGGIHSHTILSQNSLYFTQLWPVIAFYDLFASVFYVPGFRAHVLYCTFVDLVLYFIVLSCSVLFL